MIIRWINTVPYATAFQKLAHQVPPCGRVQYLLASINRGYLTELGRFKTLTNTLPCTLKYASVHMCKESTATHVHHVCLFALTGLSCLLAKIRRGAPLKSG